MDFTGESSDLIEIAEEMATNQFEEQTDLGTLAMDVFQQFLATTAGLLGSALLDKGPFGFMLGYLGVSILFQTAKILEQENYFAHRTFRLDGSSGEKVLGDKFWFDDMYGDVMPITMFGSFGGVYAPVRGNTKEFSYSADIIVREFNFEESKASSITTSYSYPKLDYWLSTRNLAGYSDFDDDLVVGYLQSTGAINPFVDNIGIPEFNHAKSSVYYIENQIQEDTADNRDTYLDTIIPTIDYDSERNRFAPRYSFVDSMGGIPAPEFYTEYPVIVSDDSSAVDQYGSIYKVMEIENLEEITSIEIQLFDSESILQADIVSIDAYVVWRVTPNTFGSQTCNSHMVTLKNGEFKVNLTSGIITIGSDPALSTILNKYATKEEELDEDKFSYSVSQPKILFQIKVEKYRSISDVRDLTSEQVNKIATAQAIEAAILEYNYQFNLATQTQMGFHELIYTAIVTAISTALTMGFSAGMGSIVNSLKDSAKEVSSKMLGRLMGSVLGAAESFSVATVIGAVVKEMGQEILLDPWIESTVSGLVRRAGGNALMQMILSSIAESSREAISGPLSSLFSSESSQIQSLSERLDSKYLSQGVRPTMQQFLTEISEYKAEITSRQEANAAQMTSLRGANKVLSFISLATGFAASFLLGPFGALAYTTLATYCLTEGISLKNIFMKIFTPVVKTTKKVGNVIKNNKWQIIGYTGIGVIGAIFGAPMVGFLTPIFGPILGSIVGGVFGVSIAFLTTMSGYISTPIENYKNLFESIRSEISKIVPRSELWRGRLANWKLAKYLGLAYGQRSDGRMWNILDDIIKGKRFITQEDIKTFKLNLDQFFGEEAVNSIKFIKDFESKNQLRKYKNQQWHLHKPDFKADFFTGISNKKISENNIIPSYWYGFMGSDASVNSGLFQQSEGSLRDHRYRYDISIELQLRDKGLLMDFSTAIGLPFTQIKERTVEKWGKEYDSAYISFGCRDMIDDLNALEFSSSKDLRKEIPEYVANSLKLAFASLNRKYVGPQHLATTVSGKIALVWLRGAYDGDGHSDRTELGSASKQYLESIKTAFRIKYPVRPQSKGKNFWVLTLGARLFNAMSSVSIEYGLGLERKNAQYSESREALDILKESMEDLSVDKAQLQDLVYTFTQYQLVEIFKTTKYTFSKLLNEWNINLPPNGYWSSTNEDRNLRRSKFLSKLNSDSKSMFGDFPFKLSNYYDQALIEKLEQELGEEINREELFAIAPIRAEKTEGRIIWLMQKDLEHILDRHIDRFEIFGISLNPQDIGNLIFQTIAKYPVVRTEEGRSPGAKIYIYAIRRPGGSGYLHVLVDSDGHIVTSYTTKHI